MRVKTCEVSITALPAFRSVSARRRVGLCFLREGPPSAGSAVDLRRLGYRVNTTGVTKGGCESIDKVDIRGLVMQGRVL